MDFKFKVGDKVQSEPSGSDVMAMKAVWVATIQKVIAENDHGGCYETIGYWVPIKDEHGKVDDFWSEREIGNEPTLRQLYGSHLIERKDDAEALTIK